MTYNSIIIYARDNIQTVSERREDELYKDIRCTVAAKSIDEVLFYEHGHKKTFYHGSFTLP